MRRKERRRKNRYFINIILLFIIAGIIIWTEIEILKEMYIDDAGEYTAKKLNLNIINVQNSLTEKSNENVEQENKIDEAISQDDEISENAKSEEIQNINISNNDGKIPATYKGYDVCGKLEISKIKLVTYILKNYSEQALKISVTKFWGVNPNEVGNCCIAGHNFKNINMFHNLRELEIGDKIQVTDLKNEKVEYQIYNIYKVMPQDVTCLSQETNGEREITLITCTNDSAKRIIIRARAV